MTKINESYVRSGRKNSEVLKEKVTAMWDLQKQISDVLARLLFVIYAAIALWRVSCLKPQLPVYQVCLMSIGICCVPLELIFALKKKEYKLYNW